ncbi:MAG TPA: cyanophycinase [Longimicrobiaceae bacterium]|nr:cyanophycinase [Longimicrobiaceae bacterium]
MPDRFDPAADFSSGDGNSSPNGDAQPSPPATPHIADISGRSNHRRVTDRTPGPLVLIGGATHPQGEALGCFLYLAGAREGGKIVGITTASADPLQSAQEWMEAFAQAGADNVEIPVVDRRDRAQDRAIAALVRSADGIFLGGGDQVQLVSTLGGSRVGRALQEAYAAGVVVCGTSAGAAALTETILAGGEPDEYGQMHDLYMGPGFGMLGFRAVIDTHFAQRRRLQRLFMVVAQNPELMGLGIDEDTSLVVQGHLGKVVGRGSVTFVDGRGVRFDNAEECVREGAPLTLSYLRVGVIGAGYTFNLRERELENLVQARAHEEETPVVRGEGVEELAAEFLAGE